MYKAVIIALSLLGIPACMHRAHVSYEIQIESGASKEDVYAWIVKDSNEVYIGREADTVK